MHRLADELAMVKELLRNHPQGMSVTEIATALGRNKHSTGRYLDILHAAGHVDLRTFGMAKVFTLSSRVPLSALLSYTTDLVLVLDRDMRIIQGNDPFFELLSMKSEAVLEKRISQLNPTDPEITTLLSVIEEKIHEDCETFEISRTAITNGEELIRFFRGKIIPTVFEDGSSAFTIILEDITLERKALKSLKESEEFFRSVSDHLSDGLIVSEIESGQKKIIFSNQRLCEITGYNQKEILCIDPQELALPEEKERLKKAISDAEKNQGSLIELRFWARKKDRTPVYLSIRVKIVPFGSKTRCYILITDITSWKEQEEAQLLQATLIKRLLTNFSHPIFILREDGTFFSANPAFCELINTKPEEVTGKHAHEVMPEAIARAFLEGNDSLICMTPSTHVVTTITFFQKDGNIGPVTVEKSPVSTGQNAPIYIFGIMVNDYENDCFSHNIIKKEG